MQKSIINFFLLIKKNKLLIILLTIFLIHLFLRFYDIETKNKFSWDQTDYAWAAKNIIVNNQLPLVGTQQKANSGIHIGPLYYYFIFPFYLAFNLDPIASGIISGVVSIITFFTLFYITKKVFSSSVSLVTIFIYTVSFYAIMFDKLQWPINFMTPISLIIFYALYNVLTGKEKYLILLALSIGFSFHIHFTSIFFPIIVFLSLPFFPRNKNTVKYILISIPLFLAFLLPNFISELIKTSDSSKSTLNYINTYYHGIHFTRILQLTKDAFIKFDSILRFEFLNILKFILTPIFIILYFFIKPNKERFILSYLVGLWFLVPWVVFSTYKGELSDYYFSSTLPLVYIILAYLTVFLFNQKFIVAKLVVIFFWIYFSYVNLSYFFEFKDPESISVRRKVVLERAEKGDYIGYTYGVPESYFYYLYLRNNREENVIKTYFDVKKK